LGDKPPDSTNAGDTPQEGVDWNRPSESRLLAGGVWATIVSFIGGMLTWLWGSIILPRFLLPHAASYGVITIISSYTGFIGGVVNWSVYNAMNKYFSEFYQQDPEKALAFVRYAIRYKSIVGIFMGSGLIFIGLFIVPYFFQSSLTWAFAVLIAISSMSWFCGSFDAFNNLIYARQRFDYQNIIALLGTIAAILVTWGAITALNLVFPNDPTTAGAIGIGIGGLAQTAMQWVASYFAILKLNITGGKSLRSFKFTPAESKMMFNYGKFMMLQDTLNSLTSVGGFIWVFVIQLVIQNPVALANAIGFWNIGYNYTGVLGYSGLLSAPLFPSISESHAAHDYKLRDRYIAISFKWAFSIGVPETLVYVIAADNLIVGFTGSYWAPSVPILMFGLTGVFISNIGNYIKSIANGVGLTRLPFYYNLIQLLIMPFALYGFVSWFAIANFPGIMPIVGAAFALIAQQVISTIILWILLRRNLAFHIPAWVAWFPLLLGGVLLIPFVLWITPWVNATVPLWIGAIILIGLFLGIYFLLYLFFGGLTPSDIAISRDIFKGNKAALQMVDGVEQFMKHSPFYGKFDF